MSTKGQCLLGFHRSPQARHGLRGLHNEEHAVWTDDMRQTMPLPRRARRIGNNNQFESHSVWPNHVITVRSHVNVTPMGRVPLWRVLWNSGFWRSPHAHVIGALYTAFCKLLPYPFVLVPPYRTTGIHSYSARLVATDDYNNKSLHVSA